MGMREIHFDLEAYVMVLDDIERRKNINEKTREAYRIMNMNDSDFEEYKKEKLIKNKFAGERN